MEKIRSFIAIDVEESLRPKIAEIQDTIAQTNAKIRFVKPENVHYTLKFLGNISTQDVDEIFELLKTIPFKSFILEIGDVGCFPNLRRPRVIWMGTGKGSEEISLIANNIVSKLKNLGFKPEKKKFVPHLTIGRVKFVKNRQALAKRLTELTGVEIGTMNVETIRLKKSQLTPEGPIYSTLKEVKATD